MKSLFSIFSLAFIYLFAFSQGTISGISNPPVALLNSDTALETGYYLIVDSSAYKRQVEKTGEILYIKPTPLLTVDNISSMKIIGKETDLYVGPVRPNGRNPIHYILKFNLNDNGVCAWAKAIVNDTVSYRRIAFVLNDKVIQIQKFDIKTETIIQGTNWDTKDDLEKIKKAIEMENKK